MDSFGSNIRVFRVQTCTDTSIGTSHLGDVDRSNVSSISQTSREKEGEKEERRRGRKRERGSEEKQAAWGSTRARGIAGYSRSTDSRSVMICARFRQ